MSESTWTVGIVSTDYDLHEERKAIADELESRGFNVVAFEQPEFAVEPHVHSHDACLLALKSADIVVVVINKRYGGLYLGKTGDISITQKEYESALSAHKLVVCCVHKRAWDERHYLYQLAKTKGISIDEARLLESPHYVEKWEVVDFIDKIHKATTDNFIRYFEGKNDLIQHILGHLQGLSRYLLEQIVRAQIGEVKSAKTTTGMALSFGDVIDKGYFVEPPYRLKSGTSDPGATASVTISLLQVQNAGIALLGGAGGGKSTLIAKAFLDHAQACVTDKSARIPFFVSLRGKGSEYHFSFPQYVNECFANSLSKLPYPELSLDGIEPVFYLDGFDELSEDIANIDQQRIASSDFFKSGFVLSCRSRFVDDYDMTLGSRFSKIIELLPWDLKLADDYVDHFCEARNRNELKIEIKNAFKSSDNMTEIAANPLLLTLFLWVVEQGDMELPLDVISRITLYDKCLGLWARRDLARIHMDGTREGRETQADLTRAWQLGAWEAYRSRFDSSGRITLPDMLKRVVELDSGLSAVCQREAFTSLFDVRPITEYVVGMIHEQLLEHLVARAIAQGTLENKAPFPDSLHYFVRPEINRTIRSIWEGFDTNAQNRILDHLWTAYTRTLANQDAASITLRNQATYYMGRILTDEARQKLTEAAALEGNVFVKPSIAFGLIKRLDMAEEERFLATLKQVSELDAANRGYHLVYYRDWPVKDKKPPYLDPGDVPWNKTLVALLRHLESTSPKHVALRRVELFTMRRLIEVRASKGPLTNPVMDRIEKSMDMDVYRAVEFPKGFSDTVKQEFGELRSAWEAAAP